MSNPRSDRIFRAIFQRHPGALKHLLNSFLPLAHPIVSIEYMPVDLLSEDTEGRSSIVDISCRDSTGRQFIVEMQLQKQQQFFKRVFMNAARIYSRQLKRGGNMNHARPVYSLCLLDYTMFPYGDHWVHHVEPTVDTHPGTTMGEIVVTFVEMRKWLELGNFDRTDIRHAWMMFFTQPERMIEIYTPEEKKRFEELYEAVDAWDLTRYTEEELEKMDYRIRQELGWQAYMLQYFEDGRQEGLSNGIETVVKVLDDMRSANGMNDAEIASRHAISVEKVQRIRQAMGPAPGAAGSASSA